MNAVTKIRDWFSPAQPQTMAASTLMLLVLSLCCNSAFAKAVENLDITIDTTSGSYHILLSGKAWFNSGPIAVRYKGECLSNEKLLSDHAETILVSREKTPGDSLRPRRSGGSPPIKTFIMSPTSINTQTSRY